MTKLIEFFLKPILVWAVFSLLMEAGKVWPLNATQNAVVIIGGALLVCAAKKTCIFFYRCKVNKIFSAIALSILGTGAFSLFGGFFWLAWMQADYLFFFIAAPLFGVVVLGFYVAWKDNVM